MSEVARFQLAQDMGHWLQTSSGVRLKPSPSASVPISMEILLLAERDTVLDVTERCSAKILQKGEIGACLRKEEA